MIDNGQNGGLNSKRGGLALALGAGAGFGVTHLLYVLVKAEPTRVLGMVENFGPLFLICAGLMYIADRRAGQLIDTNRENAVAMKALADGVQQIAARDDQRARELDLTLAMISKNSEDTLNIVGRITQQVDRLPCQPASKGGCPGEAK